MLNKIYKNIKDFITEYLSSFLILFILVFISYMPVNYYIITGGGTMNAEDKVFIKDEYKSKGSLNFSYVSELRGNVFSYVLSYIVPSFERESIDTYKVSKNEDSDDIDFRNKLWLNNTNNIALYVAYKKLNKDIKVNSDNIYVFAISDKAKTDLRVGDSILAIDGEKGNSLKKLRELLNKKEAGKKIDLLVSNGSKEYHRYAYPFIANNEKYIGIELIEDIDYKVSPKAKFNFSNSEGGPSGGLMLTLEIYNKLTKNDITKGLNIAGTGTIDYDGNVGSIDGVKFKIRGAEKNNMDIFLVPKGRNYKEAMKEKKKSKLKIKVIPVETFDEAISSLSKLK